MENLSSIGALIEKDKPAFSSWVGPSTFFLPIEAPGQITRLTDQEKYQICVICIGQCLTIGIRHERFLKYLNIPGFTKTHFYENYSDEKQKEANIFLLLKCRYGERKPLIGNILEAQVVRLVLAMLRTCGIENDYFLEVFEAAGKTI